jgi:hypothetical protein
MYIADLAAIDDPRVTLCAVGWLEPEHRFEQGRVDESFFARLMTLLVEPWQPFAVAGFHHCGFCRFTGGPGTIHYQPQRGGSVSAVVGASNIFVPGLDAIYMAPSLIAHYIDAHAYRPPDEFIAAVMTCPEMRSAAYLRAIHALGGAVLLKPPAGEAGLGSLAATVVIEEPCPQCGERTQVSYRQKATPAPRYSVSVRCAHCGHAVESDGTALPKEIRDRFYARGGRWGLRLVDAGSEKTKLARVLAEQCSIPPASALKLLADHDALLLEGTRVEVDALAAVLKALGARSRAILLR